MKKYNLYENYHSKNKIHKKVIVGDEYTYRNIISILEKYLPKKGRVLDIGSATGTMSFFLASKGLIVDGIELSTNAVKDANKNKYLLNVKRVNFKNVTIENYENTKKYEVIICFEVLEHLKKDSIVLSKIYSIMKNNAIFAISVPSLNAPLYKLGLLKRFDKNVGHLRRYTANNLKYLLKDCGFKIIEIKKCEGIVRNIIFTNKYLGWITKLLYFKLFNNVATVIDNLTVSLFGESQIIIICKKA